MVVSFHVHYLSNLCYDSWYDVLIMSQLHFTFFLFLLPPYVHCLHLLRRLAWHIYLFMMYRQDKLFSVSSLMDRRGLWVRMWCLMKLLGWMVIFYENDFSFNFSWFLLEIGLLIESVEWIYCFLEIIYRLVDCKR